MHLNKNELTKLLLEVRNRYSQELVELLRQMLEIAPIKRIDYSNLIDQLHPLLTSNLGKIQKLYHAGRNNGNNQESANQSLELMKRFAEFEDKYQRVLANSSLLAEKRVPLHEGEILRDEKKILKQLKEKAKQRHPQYMGKAELYDLYLSEYHLAKKNRST